MAPKTLWLVPALLAAGCDPLHSLRIDVREGPTEAAKMVSVRSLAEAGGKPIEGVNVELWARDRAGKRVVWDLASRTGADGRVEFGPFWLGGTSAWELRCTKTGYAPVQGRYPIAEVKCWPIGAVPARKSLLVVMKRIEER